MSTKRPQIQEDSAISIPIPEPQFHGELAMVTPKTRSKTSGNESKATAQGVWKHRGFFTAITWKRRILGPNCGAEIWEFSEAPVQELPQGQAQQSLTQSLSGRGISMEHQNLLNFHPFLISCPSFPKPHSQQINNNSLLPPSFLLEFFPGCP